MKYSVLFFSLICLVSCERESGIKIRQVLMPDGRKVNVYRLENKQGISVDVMEYGATLLNISIPDNKGKFENILAGYDSVSTYFTDQSYFNCIVGRYANRIANGKFSLQGKEYNLPRNEKNINHLHGGVNGFHKKLWKGSLLNEGNRQGVVFNYTSPDGEEGYPGTLNVTVTYSLNDSNELHIGYKATTDKATIVNLSSHTYYNLTGESQVGILEHQLQINADSFLTIDRNLIPFGKRSAAENTPFDFRQAKPVGKDIAVPDSQLIYANGGYDHNFVLNRKKCEETIQFALRLTDPQSGRILEIYTDQPGLQFYSGNFFNGSLVGRKGGVYQKYGALVFETQKFPDSPNHADFPSTELLPGQTYQHNSVLKFKVIK